MVKKKSVKGAESFYIATIQLLEKSKIPFLIGGTYAIRWHTGIKRPTKDLDIFTRASDYPKILTLLKDQGFTTEITDERWTAKAGKDDHVIDIIFGSPSGLCPVDDLWFEHATTASILDQKVLLIPIVEMIWSNAFIQDRYRYNGADIYHLILRNGQSLDWQRLLNRMDPHWEVLLSHIINYRFIYPSERDNVPKWLLEDLLGRVHRQLELPLPKDRVSRGPLLSQTQYEIDFKEWGFKVITYAM